MVRTERIRNKYGLIGKNIAYSFSRSYFSSKFAELRLDSHSYENFDLESIEDFPVLISSASHLKGLNVTIPYKEAIIPYLDELDPEAAKIGAVNTIQFTDHGLIGHNTDVYGFKEALLTKLKREDHSALILGTGGASKAVAYVLKNLGIKFKFVSRNPVENHWHYHDLNKEILDHYSLIINTTPLGTYPNIEQKPDIPYEDLGPGHFLFDLVYNPETTAFLQAGITKGCRVLNGKKMLELQAEKAWTIWNS